MSPNAPDNPVDVERTDDAQGGEAEHQPKPPLSFYVSVFATFFWIIFGLSFIYGYRVWWDAPPDPSFVPFIGVGFAVIVAFTIVLTLRYATGEIELSVLGLTLKGGSGPILLWAVCFLCIVFGLYLLGAAKILDGIEQHHRLPLPEVRKPSTLKLGER